jgi:hypothetical protein
MNSSVGVSVSKTGLAGCVLKNNYISPMMTIGSKKEAYVTSVPARIINFFVYSDIPMDDLNKYVDTCYNRADGFQKVEYGQGLHKIFRFRTNKEGDIDRPVMIEYNFKYLARAKSSYIHRFQFDDLFLDLHLVDKLFQRSPNLSGPSMFKIIKILSNNNNGRPLELTIDTIYDEGENITEPTEIMGFIKLYDSRFTLRARSRMQLEATREQQWHYVRENGDDGYLRRVSQMQRATTGSFDINYRERKRMEKRDETLFKTLYDVAERVRVLEGQMRQQGWQTHTGQQNLQSIHHIGHSLVNISPTRRQQSPQARQHIETSPISNLTPTNRQQSPPLYNNKKGI